MSLIHRAKGVVFAFIATALIHAAGIGALLLLAQNGAH
jgi:hypothetical protein